MPDSKLLPWLIPGITAVILAIFFVPECFSPSPFHSWDLHGHIALVDRLAEQLRHGRILFYDHWWFTGWPAFSFYPPFGHLAASLITFPLSVFSPDAARLSCQLLIGLSVAALPLSVFGAAKRIFESESADRRSGQLFVLACSASLFSCWFLAHPEYYYGLGSLSGTHLGLFSQLLGWHGLLLYAGLLFPCLTTNSAPTRRRLAALSFSLALLLLIHTLTFLFIAGFAALLLVWRRASPRIWFAHLLGIGLSCWWLIPALADGPTYAPLDQLPGEGDFISLLLQTSPADALRTLLPRYIGAYPLMPAVFLVLLACILHPRVRGCTFLMAALFFCFFTQMIFVSDFFAKNFPFSLHLYRFLGVAVLLFVTFFSLVPAALASSVKQAALLSTVLIGIQLHELVVWSRLKPVAVSGPILESERKLLEYLKTSPPQPAAEAQTRVLFELPAAAEFPDFPSPHFLPAALGTMSRREAGNGLFIQSSLTQVFLTNTAAQLKLDFYGTPELDSSDISFSSADFAAQLRDFGISTVVSTKGKERSLFTPLAQAEPRQFGELFVYELGFGDPPLRRPKKHLLGYLDRAGSLPFKVFEYVLYSHKGLWQDVDVLSLAPDAAVPPEIEEILINDADTEDFRSIAAGMSRRFAANPPLIRNLKFLHPPRNFEASEKEQLAALINHARRYLINQLDLPGKLAGRPDRLNQDPSAVLPGFSPDWPNQRIRLSGLTPGKVVRLNYSYAPAWSSDQGVVFRGSQERLWFLPAEPEAELRYRPLFTPKLLVGLLCSLLSVLLIPRILRNPASALTER